MMKTMFMGVSCTSLYFTLKKLTHVWRLHGLAALFHNSYTSVFFNGSVQEEACSYLSGAWSAPHVVV